MRYPSVYLMLYNLPSWQRRWATNYTLMRCWLYEILSSYSSNFIKITDLWDVAPCSLVEIYQSFGGISCCHLRGGSSLGLHGFTSQITTIFRVKTCRVRWECLDYIGRLQGTWSRITTYFELFGLVVVYHLGNSVRIIVLPIFYLVLHV
jgi:hypothetical protein